MEDSLAHLAGGLHPTDEAEEHYYPGDGQAAQDGEAHFTKVPNAVWDVQDIIPKQTGQMFIFVYLFIIIILI